MEISTFHPIQKAYIQKMGSLKKTIETHHFGTGEMYTPIIMFLKSGTFDLFVILTV